jgi:hypothetical protein
MPSATQSREVLTKCGSLLLPKTTVMTYPIAMISGKQIRAARGLLGWKPTTRNATARRYGPGYGYASSKLIFLLERGRRLGSRSSGVEGPAGDGADALPACCPIALGEVPKRSNGTVLKFD